MATILVVEDDHDVLKLIKFILEMAGFDVHLIEDGSGVIPCLRDRKIDLILLDLKIGGMDGLAICRSIKTDAIFRTISIIVITGHMEHERKQESMEMGVSDYMVKPFSNEELLEKVNYHLEKSVEKRRLQ